MIDTDFDDQMYEEGRNAEEDELADTVQSSYEFYREDKGYGNSMAIEYTAQDLKLDINQVERYIW